MDDDHRSALPAASVTRRRLLGVGAAATLSGAIGATAVPAAHAAPTTVSVPPASGDEDSTAAIQAAVDALPPDGGTVSLEGATYLVGHPIALRSGVTLTGAGAGTTRLVDHPSLGNRPLLSIVGSEGASVSAVTVAALSLRNGTASTGSFAAGRDGIVIDHANRVLLERIEVTEIQGQYGVRAQRTAGLDIRSSRFHRCTYGMVIILPDCSRVHVADCEFDTLTSTVYPNTYTFATGYATLNSGTRWTRGLVVEDCTFRNNPRWEGLDAHGATDVVFRRNHIENVQVGIVVGNTNGAVTDPRLERVLIEDNTIIQGTGRPGWYGIVVTGAARRARDVTIRGNRVRGFGGTDSRIGTINVFRADEVTIEDNTIDDYGMNGINLYYGVFGARITGNRIRNLGNRVAGQPTSAITAVTSGCYGLVVGDNVIESESPDQQPDFAFRAAGNQSWQLAGNQVLGGTRVATYSGIDHLPVDKDVLPTATALQYHGGDVLLSGDGPRVAWRAVQPRDGYGSTDTSTVMGTARVRAGDREVELLAGGPTDWTVFPPGMSVVVEGAGRGGESLHTTVLANTGTMSAGDKPYGPTILTLADPPATSQDAAALRHGALRLLRTRA